MSKEKKSISKLRLIREQKGLTQKDMGELLGYSNAWYAKMEEGEIKILPEERRKIAGALGCKISDLFTKTKKLRRQVFTYKISKVKKPRRIYKKGKGKI